MVRKKFFSSEVEPVPEVGFLKDIFVVVGRRDLGNGDALELYTDEDVRRTRAGRPGWRRCTRPSTTTSPE